MQLIWISGATSKVQKFNITPKGLMKIDLENGIYKLTDQTTWEQEKQGELKEVFRDGKLLVDISLSEIRENRRIKKNGFDFWPFIS